MITVVSRHRETVRRLQRIRRTIRSGEANRVIERVAWQVHAKLVNRTPKGYTGNTRKSWKVEKQLGLGYAVSNTSKVMAWLEEGTRPHGPVEAGALFIPLNKKAAHRGPISPAQREAGETNGLIRGQDFILARRVDGIRALRIVQRMRPVARRLLDIHMRRFLRRTIHGR